MSTLTVIFPLESFRSLYKSFCPSSGIYDRSTAALTDISLLSTHGFNSGTSLLIRIRRAAVSFPSPYSFPACSSLLSGFPSITASSWAISLAFSFENSSEWYAAITAACSVIFISLNPLWSRLVNAIYICASFSVRFSLIIAGHVVFPASRLHLQWLFPASISYFPASSGSGRTISGCITPYFLILSVMSERLSSSYIVNRWLWVWFNNSIGISFTWFSCDVIAPISNFVSISYISLLLLLQAQYILHLTSFYSGTDFYF